LSAGNEREALLAVANRLSIELGYRAGEEAPYADSTLGGDEGTLFGILDPEDELLVSRMRRALANVVAAAGGDSGGIGENAVGMTLDGIETVMRGELVSGNADRLSELLPSFVFLVTLPVVHQDRALELSRRAAQLVEGTLG
jgi:hypothetical protein